MNLNALGKFQKSTQTNAGICNSCSSGCKQMSWGHLFVNHKIHLWIMKYICESRFVRLNRVSFVCDSRFVCLNRVSFVCELWNKSNSIEVGIIGHILCVYECYLIPVSPIVGCAQTLTISSSFLCSEFRRNTATGCYSFRWTLRTPDALIWLYGGIAGLRKWHSLQDLFTTPKLTFTASHCSHFVLGEN